MSAIAEKTLLEFLVDLLSDKHALADFQHDPEGALKAAGLDHVCVQDIQELLPVVLEKCSPEDCAKYEDDCDDDKCHDDKWCDDDEHHEGKHHDDCHDDWHGSHHDHDHEMAKVITHLTYVTNNYTIDNSINVWNHGNGDVLIVNGDGNIIGDGNVTGDGNTIGDGNDSGNVHDGNVIGDLNGSGNVAADLGLGGLGFPTLPVDPSAPLGGELPDPAGETEKVNALKTLAVVPQVPGADPGSTDDEDSEGHLPAHHEAPHVDVTEVHGDGNILGNGNVTGDGNTVGDDNHSGNIGDGNVIGDGNGSGNTDIHLGDAPEPQADLMHVG